MKVGNRGKGRSESKVKQVKGKKGHGKGKKAH